MRAHHGVVPLALALLALAAPARADKRLAPAQSNARSADQLADEAYQKHAAGDYQAAIDLYLKAFAISEDARVLYNVAAIYDKKLHQNEQAIVYYRRYLHSASTEPELIDRVNVRLSELEKESPRERPSPATARPVPKSEPPPADPYRPLGYSLVGVGIIGIGVGTVFGLSALSKSSELKDECPNNVCPDANGPALRDDASQAATLSTVFIGGGLALAAAGTAVLLFVAPKRMAVQGLTLHPMIGAGRIVVGGRF